MLTASALAGLGVAFACGLLIGIERERRKGSGPTRHYAGIRSFALAALVGGLAQALGGGLVLVGGALILALSVIAHWRDRSDDPGVTTELALFLSFLLGVAAIDNPGVAAGAAVVVAATLNLRSRLHHFARVSLKPGELRDGLLLAGAALLVRPLLPDVSSAWLLGMNPKTLWTLVVLIMCIQAAAHIALRLAGPRLGLAMSGFASGFVSSIATIAALGARCRHHSALRDACVAGALLSNIATVVLLWIVAGTVAPAYLGQLAPTLACAGFAALAVGALSLAAARGGSPYLPPTGRAFSIRQAVLFALLLSAAAAALAYANAQLGSGALLAGAAVAGFFDVHAAAGSALSLLASGAADPPAALLALLLAITANMVSKAVAAFAGGWQFAWRVNVSLLFVLL
ncbi:MAG TPA: MgtC/SapB family protein, partial [Telluria sp.]|nr:MgtC/SapB family protein [Telluria sp.]